MDLDASTVARGAREPLSASAVAASGPTVSKSVSANEKDLDFIPHLSRGVTRDCRAPERESYRSGGAAPERVAGLSLSRRSHHRRASLMRVRVRTRPHLLPYL